MGWEDLPFWWKTGFLVWIALPAAFLAGVAVGAGATLAVLRPWGAP